MQTFAQTTAVGNNPTSGSNRINQQTRPVSCSSVNYKQSSQNNSTNLRFGFNTTNAALHARDICTSSTSSAADSTASTVATTGEVEIRPGVYQGFWTWNGHRIRYLRSGTEGPAVLCIHGFGGNGELFLRDICKGCMFCLFFFLIFFVLLLTVVGFSTMQPCTGGKTCPNSEKPTVSGPSIFSAMVTLTNPILVNSNQIPYTTLKIGLSNAEILPNKLLADL